MEQSKQKKIEEIVRFIDIHNEAKKIANLMPSDIVGYDGKPKSQHLYIEQKMEIAKEIIKQGAVVLTREEFDKKLEPFRLEIISLSQELIETSQKLMKAHKETAEKFAEMAKEAIINMKWARDDTHIKLVTQGDCLKAIDEICKEITEGKDGNYKQDCRLDSKRKL